MNTMRNLIERLRNDTLDDNIRDTALEAADALERLTAGDVELPIPTVFHFGGQFLQHKWCVVDVVKDYGDRRAAAAVLAVSQPVQPALAQVVAAQVAVNSGTCETCLHWDHAHKRNISHPESPAWYAECLYPLPVPLLPLCVSKEEMPATAGAVCPCFTNKRRK